MSFWFPYGPNGEGDPRSAAVRRTLAVVAVVIVAAVCLAAAWAVAALSEGAGCRAGRPDSARFLLLTITETDNRVLQAAIVPGLAPGPEVTIDADRRRLVVARRGLVPRGRYRALVRYLAEDFDVPLGEGLLAVRRLPWRFDLGRSLGLSRRLGDLGSIDPSKRLVSGPLALLSIEAAGAAVIEHLGNQLTLRPGESYARLWVNDGGTVRVIEPGDEWRRVMEEALAGRVPVSRLIVANHGWWTQGEMVVGDTASPVRPCFMASPSSGGE